MRINGKWICLFAVIVLLSGCGQQKGSDRSINNGNSVDKVIESQVQKEDEQKTLEENGQTAEEAAEETEQAQAQIDAPAANVDVDLSVMDSDMIYATVYQMMSDPEQYVGKTFRIEGKFYVTYDEMTKNQYYYCVIKDATECCAQGLEFVWGDGSHVYPDEYPSDGTEAVVDGTFELYTENDSKYCRLINAEFYF